MFDTTDSILKTLQTTVTKLKQRSEKLTAKRIDIADQIQHLEWETNLVNTEQGRADSVASKLEELLS